MQTPTLPKSTILVNLSKSLAQSLGNIRSGILDLYPSHQSKLILELAAYNPRNVLFGYYEFTNNNQIQDLFDCFFQLYHTYTNYDIIDCQTNINHSLFRIAIGNIKTVHYHTQLLYDDADAKTENSKIRVKFRSSHVYRINKDNVHERKLKINNFILSTDEDFQNLSITRETWNLVFLVCDSNSNAINLKKRLFRKDTRM